MNKKMQIFSFIQDEMQDGMLIVRDEGETQTQIIALRLDMSLRPYNLVATKSYSLPALLDNKMGDAVSTESLGLITA